MFHELGHWTAHPSRLNRDLQHRFGSSAYAREELIAGIDQRFSQRASEHRAANPPCRLPGPLAANPERGLPRDLSRGKPSQQGNVIFFSRFESREGPKFRRRGGGIGASRTEPGPAREAQNPRTGPVHSHSRSRPSWNFNTSNSANSKSPNATCAIATRSRMCADILPSIRAKGVLQPLIVRPEDGRYGVVAGRRRYFSLRAVKAECGEVAPRLARSWKKATTPRPSKHPCSENRRAPRSRPHAGTRNLRAPHQGGPHGGRHRRHLRHDDDAGESTPRARQSASQDQGRLSCRGNRRRDGAPSDTRLCGQQRKWLRLFSDPHQYCPRGHQLKQWLFGGQQISTTHALFKLADYTGQTIEDLFGEDSYFADADLFWALQNRAIAAKRDALLKAGWTRWT